MSQLNQRIPARSVSVQKSPPETRFTLASAEDLANDVKTEIEQAVYSYASDNSDVAVGDLGLAESRLHILNFCVDRRAPLIEVL